MSKTKIETLVKSHLTIRRLLAFIGLGLLFVVALRSPISAENILQGYKTDQTLQRGMIVQLKKGDESKVETASRSRSNLIFGVTADENKAQITLSNNEQQIYVTTGGRYEILVSDQNGIINSGDYVSISSIDGVGMKADENDELVIGRAVVAFDPSKTVSNSVINDASGGKKDVKIGRVLSDVGVSKNPIYKNNANNLPNFLNRASESIAGHSVRPWRVYTAAAIFVVSIVLACILLYGGIRGAISAIGRNPLSRKFVGRSLVQVVAGGLAIFLTGISAVYLILRL